MRPRELKRRLPPYRLWPFAQFSLLLILCSAIGCRQQSGPIAQEQTNLGWLGSMYAMYVSENQGRTPGSIDDFKKYIAGRTTNEQLARLGVASAEELFISPRDGKPFSLVTYTTLPTREAGQPAPVVLYETEGQGGQRAIALLGGSTMNVDEKELPKLLSAPASPAR